jgi:hypothetical protein
VEVGVADPAEEHLDGHIVVLLNPIVHTGIQTTVCTYYKH